MPYLIPHSYLYISVVSDANGVWDASMRSSNWGLARRRYLSDSCLDNDDNTGLLSDDLEGYESSDGNLRLPAIPKEKPYLERCYSLPDLLDDGRDDNLSVHAANGGRNTEHRRFIDAASFVTSAKNNSLRRKMSRRGSGDSFRRSRAGEAGVIMRRGWFDVRKSIRVKVSWRFYFYLVYSFLSLSCVGGDKPVRGSLICLYLASLCFFILRCCENLQKNFFVNINFQELCKKADA